MHLCLLSLLESDQACVSVCDQKHVPEYVVCEYVVCLCTCIKEMGWGREREREAEKHARGRQGY